MRDEGHLVRVLIVDDAVIFRQILNKALSKLPDVEVAAAVPSGELALKRLETSPIDLVLLDVFMPGMDGVQTLKQIRQKFPDVAVVMVSGVATNDAAVTIEALNLGALDFIPKPKEQNMEASMRAITADLQRVLEGVYTKSIATRKTPIPKKPTPAPSPPAVKERTVIPTQFDLIVIGVSTGGPNALGVVIPKLPASLKCPVLMVQHMPPMFTASLADHLDKKSPLSVREGVENQSVEPGTIWIAPGGRHMTVRKDPGAPPKLLLGLNDQPPVNSCRPAVDVLFHSVAATTSGNVLAVILTGMGEDGAAGVAALKRKNGYCLAQDEKTCVVYGMPRAVAERNLADEVLPLESIPQRIAELAGCLEPV